MGFKLKVNTILRQSDIEEMEVGKEYGFEKEGLSVLADTMPIWLCGEDWTPAAEIMVVSQRREENMTTGRFRVLYVYSGQEQEVLKIILKRMYSDK